jgi:hypothetical protein
MTIPMSGAFQSNLAYRARLTRTTRPKIPIQSAHANSTRCVNQLVQTLGPLGTDYIPQPSQTRQLRHHIAHRPRGRFCLLQISVQTARAGIMAM